MNTEIKLIRTPEIAHKLVEIGSNVTARIAELGIETLIATEDTVKSLKELRADLNKELSDFEDQRKLVKKGIMNPYDEFEGIYKTEVSEKYTKAINTLKDKIAIVETKIKDEKTAEVKLYFDELVLAEKIDFLKFENLGLDINLSTTAKKYKEQINAFISRTQDDIALIKSTDFEAEAMTEYKKTLNASLSITTVKNRKEQEKIETERIKLAENNRRKEKLRSLGMVYLDMTNSYEYDEEILMQVSDVDGLPKDQFEAKILELESKIKAKKEILAPATHNEPVKVVPTPVQKPVEQAPKAEIVNASFRVEGTMTQLRALGEYMKSNGIKYTNLNQ